MEAQEAHYILDYFSRLMTREERLAKKHYLFSAKLGSPEDYVDIEFYESRRKFFLKNNGMTEDPAILALLKEGYSEFTVQAAARIKRENSRPISHQSM